MDIYRICNYKVISIQIMIYALQGEKYTYWMEINYEMYAYIKVKLYCEKKYELGNN